MSLKQVKALLLLLLLLAAIYVDLQMIEWGYIHLQKHQSLSNY